MLATTLIVAGVVTTLLGAGLGRFASRRSLRPLTDVSRAAVAIAGGQLDTRLPSETTDPDLEGLTTSFNAMVDQIQSRIEREARFNSDVSHELRSPLTTLAASLEVLERDLAELPPRAQRALQLLGEDLRRFQRMVGDLLEMSRADAGSMDVFLDEVNVGELVRRAVEAGVRTLGEGATAPEVHITPDLEMVHVGVDKRRFERVMTNLLENAENYGGGAVVHLGRCLRERDARSALRPDRGGGRRSGHRCQRTDQGLRTLLPGLGVRPAGHRYGYRPRTGPGGRAHAPHARRGVGRVVIHRRRPFRHRPARPRRERHLDVVRRRGAVCAVLLVGGLALAACGIPTQQAPSSISSSRVPVGLASPGAGAPPPTQPNAKSEVRVTIYLLDSDNTLAPVYRFVQVPAPLESIITAMLGGPTQNEENDGLYTAIPSDVAVLSPPTSRGRWSPSTSTMRSAR